MHDHDTLLRRGLILEYLTLGWNVVGSIIVLFAAMHSHSVALAGFGLDSVVEIGASTVVIWQLHGVHRHREQTALRLIAISFVALAVYILVQSIQTLVLNVHTTSSPVGIIWLAFTFVVMLALAAGKNRVGMALNNPVLTAEAKVTLVDAYLAGSVLLGLVLNTTFGWWWADPVAGLVIVFYGFREGRHAWKEAKNAA